MSTIPVINPATIGTGAGTGSNLLNSMLGSVTGVLNPISNIAGIIGGLTGAFQDPVGEKSIRSMEANVAKILDDWRAGKIDTDVAMAMVRAQQSTFMGHESSDRQSQANQFMDSVLGEMAQQRQNDLNAAWGTSGETYAGGVGIPGGANPAAGGVPGSPGSGTSYIAGQGFVPTGGTPSGETSGLTGSAEFQKERANTLMRNMMLNTETGQQFGEATGLNKLLGSTPDPKSLYDSYRTTTPNTSLDTLPELGSQIQNSMNKFGRY